MAHLLNRTGPHTPSTSHGPQQDRSMRPQSGSGAVRKGAWSSATLVFIVGGSSAGIGGVEGRRVFARHRGLSGSHARCLVRDSPCVAALEDELLGLQCLLPRGEVFGGLTVQTMLRPSMVRSQPTRPRQAHIRSTTWGQPLRARTRSGFARLRRETVAPRPLMPTHRALANRTNLGLLARS